jgi:pSer/pThr/pTyr-binding forkhead associated (FHA) protein
MSDTQIVLEVVEGSLKGNQYHFDNPIRIVIGHAFGCDIQLPDENNDAEATQYQCLLDVDPPYVHVRDLDAGHGVLLNGVPVGPPSLSSQAERADTVAALDGEMTDGDELRFGDTLMRIHVSSHQSNSEIDPDWQFDE